MGYTHYWYRVEDLDAQQFAEYSRQVQEVVNNSGVIIKGWDGEGEPEFTKDVVRFNGDAASDGAHESGAFSDGYKLAKPYIGLTSLKTATSWFRED